MGSRNYHNRVATVLPGVLSLHVPLVVARGRRRTRSRDGIIAKRIDDSLMNWCKRLLSRVTAIALLSLRYTTIAALLTHACRAHQSGPALIRYDEATILARSRHSWAHQMVSGQRPNGAQRASSVMPTRFAGSSRSRPSHALHTQGRRTCRACTPRMRSELAGCAAASGRREGPRWRYSLRVPYQDS